jgi:hypothetical protein
MGIFDFLKPKKNPMEEAFEKMHNSIFPKGERDINAGIQELLRILDNKIDTKTARSILIKSAAISRISEKFDKERLRVHLAGYCLHHFNDKQLDKYFNYLTAMSVAMQIHRATPSEIQRRGDEYFW